MLPLAKSYLIRLTISLYVRGWRLAIYNKENQNNKKRPSTSVYNKSKNSKLEANSHKDGD